MKLSEQNNFVRKSVHALKYLKSRTIYSDRYKAAKELSGSYALPKNYKRIYFYHIRKTGGTSLKFAFYKLLQEDKLEEVHDRFCKNGYKDFRLVQNEKVFAGWNIPTINEGHYFFASSHLPSQLFNLKPDTFTITCFRDPVARLISHYNMVMHYKNIDHQHPGNAAEFKWLGDSAMDFFKNMPKRNLLAQLYMFSQKYSVDEAVENANKCSAILHTENLNSGLNDLGKQLNLNLIAAQQKKYKHKEEISQEVLDELRSMTEKEYQLLNQIKK